MSDDPYMDALDPTRHPELVRYPALRGMCFAVVLGAGGINRDRTPLEVWDAISAVTGAEGVYDEDLSRWDAWLSERTEKEIMTLAEGEHSEGQELLKSCPPPLDSEGSLDGLLNDVFEYA